MTTLSQNKDDVVCFVHKVAPLLISACFIISYKFSQQDFSGSSWSNLSTLKCWCFLTVTVGDGRGVTLALTLLHGGWSEGLCAVVRRLPGVRQTLHRPHLLTQAALSRTLRTKRVRESQLASVKLRQGERGASLLP